MGQTLQEGVEGERRESRWRKGTGMDGGRGVSVNGEVVGISIAVELYPQSLRGLDEGGLLIVNLVCRRETEVGGGLLAGRGAEHKNHLL